MASSVEQIPANISTALKLASKKTGISFDYLLRTAKRESNLNPAAKAPSSSATGLFQFIEQTWLKTIKENGAEYGLKTLASQISKDTKGRFKIADEATRKQILALRKDPEISALLAGAHSQDNAQFLSKQINRSVTQGDLYLAHFLGSKGAAKFLRHLDASPSQPAYKVFPQAAKANKSIFYKHGKGKSLAQVYTALTRHHIGQKSIKVEGLGVQTSSTPMVSKGLANKVKSNADPLPAPHIVAQAGQIAPTRFFSSPIQPNSPTALVKQHIGTYDKMSQIRDIQTKRGNVSQPIPTPNYNEKVLLQKRPGVQQLFGLK